jgi:insertion element IS1 protein InsB
MPNYLRISTSTFLKQTTAPFDSCNSKPQDDEIWSFIASKENKQWVWIAIDVNTKQVIAFYVGDRSASSARELWRPIPPTYRACATFYTDGLAAYKSVLPVEKHKVCAKSSGHTNIIERFNCTLRQGYLVWYDSH